MSPWIMLGRTSIALGLAVCGTVAALAASPARADDGVPSPTDPSAIIATALDSVSSATDPQVAPTPQPPPVPTVPETPTIPPVSPTIPPAIPSIPDNAEAPPEPPATVTPSSPSPPAPPVEPTTAEAPASPTASASEPATTPSDTGNTATDNSNSITPDPVTTTSQTFVWNWYWNCATDEGVPDVPAPPPGATTIVLNWHWACAAPPPSIDLAGITVCTSCNVAISVRVGSPGDTGDLVQSIVTSTAAAAANLADTIEAAAQTAIPPSASPIASPIPDAVASVTAAPLAAVKEVTNQIDDAAFLAPATPAASEDLPRHGAPTVFGGGGARPPFLGAAAGSRVDIAPGEPTSAEVRARVALLQRWIVRRPRVSTEAVAKPPRARPTAPAPFPLPPIPSAPPTPFILGAGVAGTHGGAIGVISALAPGLAMVFLYAISTALRLPPVVPPARGAGANPHPPG